MLYRRFLAVHQLRGSNDLPAECDTDALMAETDTQHGNRRPEAANQLDRDPRILGAAGPGRDHDVGRMQLADLVQGDLVVPANDRWSAQLAEILGEIERERVVVIEEEYHRYNPASAIARAVR